MSTPVTTQPQTPVAPPSGVSITLNTDGTVTVVQSGQTISLASLAAARALWQALAAVVA